MGNSENEPFEYSESSGTDTEPQVYNPGERLLRQGEAIPVPEWGGYINHWSRLDGQRLPYGMARGFYDDSKGGTTDKALPVIVHRIACQADQARISINQVLQVNVAAENNVADILRLNELRDDTQHHTEALQRKVDVAQSVITELKEQQAAQDKRWKVQDEAESSKRRSTRRK